MVKMATWGHPHIDFTQYFIYCVTNEVSWSDGVISLNCRHVITFMTTRGLFSRKIKTLLVFSLFGFFRVFELLFLLLKVSSVVTPFALPAQFLTPSGSDTVSPTSTYMLFIMCMHIMHATRLEIPLCRLYAGKKTSRTIDSTFAPPENWTQRRTALNMFLSNGQQVKILLVTETLRENPNIHLTYDLNKDSSVYKPPRGKIVSLKMCLIRSMHVTHGFIK